MSSEQSKTNNIIVFLALFIALVSVGASYATYVRLNENINNNHIVTNRLQQALQSTIQKNSDAISYLSHKKDRPVEQKITKPTNNTAIINHINAQNKVINKILEHYQSLQSQVSEIKITASKNNNFYTDSSSETNSTDLNKNIAEQKPITIEDLDQEIETAQKQDQQLSQKTESIFQSQSQDGLWAAQTNTLIQSSLDKIRTEPQFNDLGVNNIDCRESMCKVEIVSS